VSQSAADQHGSLEPIFFLSYAHARPVRGDDQRDPNRHFARFFFDLSEDLNQMIYRETGADAGAIDQTMDGSERWTEKLLQDLGTCRAFVALTSPPYFKRPWCGMEWGVFDRRVALSGDSPSPKTGLFPVRWTRTDHRTWPQRCAAVQEFSPNVGRAGTLYRERGLYGLLQGGPQEVYREVVLQLAQQIAEFCDSTEIQPLDLTPADVPTLPNVFGEAP